VMAPPNSSTSFQSVSTSCVTVMGERRACRAALKHCCALLVQTETAVLQLLLHVLLRY
jgi:hypothetical protein